MLRIRRDIFVLVEGFLYFQHDARAHCTIMKNALQLAQQIVPWNLCLTRWRKSGCILYLITVTRAKWVSYDLPN